MALLQVSLPENYTQFLDAAGLAGARIGVFRQIRLVRGSGCAAWVWRAALWTEGSTGGIVRGSRAQTPSMEA